MLFSSWRGVVGLIKPTYRPGSLEEFIRLLPEGIGVIPLFLGISAGTEKEYLAAMGPIKEKVGELARLGVDIIHPEGAPPFMLRGYGGEAIIVKELEEEYGKPVFTSGMTQVEALRALGAKRVLGVTPVNDDNNDRYSRYFSEAGFDMLAMAGMDVSFADAGKTSPMEVYAFIREQFLKHPEADAIYMLGSGWRVLNILKLLEEDLQVPVVHPVPARVWAVQKRLHVRQRVKGFGQLLEQMP